VTEYPAVTIVVLNWNNAPDTLACLESLSHLDYKNYRLLIVDNGSTDGSVARIHAAFPSLQLLETGNNLGYAEGNNVGIRQALASGAEYVFVLNNDTLVEPSMLTKLVEVAESDPDIGMAGPTIYCTEPKDRLFAAGSSVLWYEGRVCHRGMFELPGSYVHAQMPEPVDFLVGCGVLVSRKLLEQVGLLASQYYLNFEDVEWGIRANRQRFKVVYVPQAVMWHKISATLGPASPANTYYMTRNALLFFWQNGGAGLRWIALARITARTARTMLAWSLRSRYRNHAYKRRLKANLYALRDFVIGRTGAVEPDVL
jgi:GT2 family glycosyltransferase